MGNEMIGAVGRTLDVLELLHEKHEATLSTVANELEMSKSTAYRHLQTLEGRGYLIEDEDGFHLGLKFLDLGESTIRKYPAYRLAEAKVSELAAEVDERVQFMVEEHGRAVYVHQESGPHAVKANAYPGKRVPIHASAVGLAILAEFPEERVNEIIERHGLVKCTPKTITSREVLDRVLENTHERGYSLNDQGIIEGLRAVGAPVLGPDGQVIGGLSISGPLNRMRDDYLDEQLLSLLLGATNELELNIKYQ